MKPKLHVLLVGINDYSFGALNGCVNDVTAVREYLERAYPDGNDFCDLNIFSTLLDEQATRTNILAAFEKFGGAMDGDFCLFYFSGHGAFSAAPEEFWTTTDKMNKSFVCYDSRLPGGRDLMDKEMAFLLLKASQNKQLNFVVITDCCHSGGITKDIGAYSRSRNAVPDYVPCAIEEYYGYDDAADGPRYYRSSMVNGKRRITMGMAPHIHLAACRDFQPAGELGIDGSIRGVFTWSMLRSLDESNGFITYGELSHKTRLYTRSLITGQTPVLNLNNIGESSRSRVFLNTRPGSGVIRFNLSYNEEDDQWEIDAGTMQGLTIKDEIEVQDRLIPVIKCYADYSVTDTGSLRLNEAATYPVRVRRHPDGKARLKFSSDSEPEGLAWLRVLAEKSGAFIDIVDENPNYVVRASGNTYSLCFPHGDIPLFEPVTSAYNAAGAAFFLSAVGKVWRWQYLLHLQGGTNELLIGRDFGIKVYLLKYAGQYEDSDEAIDYPGNISIELRYRKKGDEWFNPVFRVGVVNQSDKIPRLYIAALLLQWDYTILPLFEPFVVDRGEGNETALRYIDDTGYPRESLSVGIPDELLRKGIHAITDYVKIFVATRPLDVGSLSQEGVSLGGEKKMITGRIDTPEWGIHTIEIDITHPGKHG